MNQGIFIDAESAVRGDIARIVIVRDANGNIVSETTTVIFGEHWVDLQPATQEDRIAGETLQHKITHFIYPEVDPGDSVTFNDFYRVLGKKYRIIEQHPYRTLRYYSVYEDIAGQPA